MLHKSSERSSLVSGPRLNSSPPGTKNPGVVIQQQPFNGMITHLKPDVLECEVKWSLGSITINKASGGDLTPVKLFQRWCCTSAALNMTANMETSAVATGVEKVSFHFSPKECSNYHLVALISHTSKVMIKILQARLNSTWTTNFQMFKLDLEKAEDHLPDCQHPLDHPKAREFQKNIYFCFIDYPKAFDCVDHSKLENSLSDGSTRLHYLSPEKPVCGTRRNS